MQQAITSTQPKNNGEYDFRLYDIAVRLGCVYYNAGEHLEE